MLASRKVSGGVKGVKSIEKKLKEKLRPPRTKEEIEQIDKGSEQTSTVINFSKPQECVEGTNTTNQTVIELESSADQEKDKFEKENKNRAENTNFENGIVKNESEHETCIPLLYNIIAKQTASVSLLLFYYFSFEEITICPTTLSHTPPCGCHCTFSCVDTSRTPECSATTKLSSKPSTTTTSNATEKHNSTTTAASPYFHTNAVPARHAATFCERCFWTNCQWAISYSIDCPAKYD
jgi:hypothetical protein